MSSFLIFGMEIDLILTIVAGVFVLLGIISGIVGFMWWQNVRHFVQTAEQAEGTVIELVESRSSDGSTYSPVIEFADRFGQRQEYQTCVGTNPPRYSVGDKVQIVYDQRRCGNILPKNCNLNQKSLGIPSRNSFFNLLIRYSRNLKMQMRYVLGIDDQGLWEPSSEADDIAVVLP